jgi:integrase
VDRSAKVTQRALAQKELAKIRREIEDGRYAAPSEPTFLTAAVAYMKAGGERRPIKKLLDHFGETPLRQIDQAAVDAAALALFPDHTAATRNRECYSPVSAVLKSAGRDIRFKRPKGSRGRVIRKWLWPEQAFRILEAARQLDPEFSIFLTCLLYSGLRLSEQLAMRCDDVRLSEAFAFVPDSKNGEPQPVALHPYAVEALKTHPRGLNRAGQRVFRFVVSGALRYKLQSACALAAGLAKPPRWKRGKPKPVIPPHEFDWVTFHSLRRSFATWMRRYAKLDDKDLVDTNRWKTIESASRYAQVVVGEAARKVSLLPAPTDVIASEFRGKSVEKDEKTG